MSSVSLTLTTPAILFPTISLLMLAYTNRFLGLANLIRALHNEYTNSCQPAIEEQIVHLKGRLHCIRHMQSLGILSLIGCVITILLLFGEFQLSAQIMFAFSLITMIASLLVSLYEISISAEALEIQLGDMAKKKAPRRFKSKNKPKMQLPSEK